jgi:predicted acetyltransferase
LVPMVPGRDEEFAQMLEELGGMRVAQALVTCKGNNAASARVIEKCGGVRISDASTPNGVEWRYWITIPRITA